MNDSPALKNANIGIAMGMNGSDVAREAADLVLLDDNFASIVVGIFEGRLLFQNLKKSCAYTLAHLLPEAATVFLYVFTGAPLGMGSIPILMIDLWTELAPAMSMAFEPAESNIMQIPPRDAERDKLTSLPLLIYSYLFIGTLFESGVLLLFYFITFNDFGISPYEIVTSINGAYFPSTNGDDYINNQGEVFSPNKQAYILGVVQGTWYLGLVMCQVGHIMFARTSSSSIWEHGFFANTYTNYAIIIEVCLGLIATYLPGWQTQVMVIRNPVSLYIFFIFLINFTLILCYTELRKYYSKHSPDTWLNKTLLAW